MHITLKDTVYAWEDDSDNAAAQEQVDFSATPPLSLVTRANMLR